ncbi:MAG: exodeoxyribonuclease VII small subunit [Spirochaetes bacterium]|nr:exodeoxyribonuclease VII small subunit [Spirochaetota bacterium]
MKNFEKKLEELETIIKKLEDEKTPLEESLNLYIKGVTIIKELNTILNNIEGKVEIIRRKMESDNFYMEDITEIFKKEESNLKSSTIKTLNKNQSEKNKIDLDLKNVDENYKTSKKEDIQEDIDDLKKDLF